MKRARLPFLLFTSHKLLMRSRMSASMLVAAVALSVGFQIPNAANLAGYTSELVRNGVVRATGHVLLTARTGTAIDDVRGRLEQLRRLGSVKAAAARYYHAGVLVGGEHGPRPLRVVGVDPADEDAATGLCSRIGAGQCLTAGGENQALVGSVLARTMGLSPGDVLRIVIPSADPTDRDPSLAKPRLVGVMSGGGAFSEDSDVIVPTALLDRILDLHDEATAILVFGSDPFRAESYAAEIRQGSPDLTVQAWTERGGFVGQAILGNRKLAGISLAMGAIAAAVPVLSLLFVHVYAERKHIGLLRALGLRVGEVFAVYMLKAAMIGAAGTALGIALGACLCAYFRKVPIFSSEGFVVQPLLTVSSVAVPSLVVLAAAVFASVAPAVSAARTDPVSQLSRG